MLTLGEVRRDGRRIWLGCGPCKLGRWADVMMGDSTVEAMTIEALHREGHLRCACCGEIAPAVIVVDRIAGATHHLERWTWPRPDQEKPPAEIPPGA